YFGGVVAECLYDNEKTVVLRWEAGKPVFNPAFTAFITHYNCRPIACRPGSPKTKGKVEAPFKYIEGNLLCGRDFQDLDDLRATARWWLENVSDRHVHDTTRRTPIELFNEEELSALQPLPAFPYDCSEVRLAVCNSESMVTFETNRYSVPTGYIGDILSIKAGERELRIYSQDLKLLAVHERHAMGENATIEDPSHYRVRREKYGLEPVRDAFVSFGEAAEDFLAGLLNKNPRNIGFQVRHIL
ncbi:transposase, partial [Enterococcus faecalis]